MCVCVYISVYRHTMIVMIVGEGRCCCWCKSHGDWVAYFDWKDDDMPLQQTVDCASVYL